MRKTFDFSTISRPPLKTGMRSALFRRSPGDNLQMAPLGKTTGRARPTRSESPEQTRLWLMFPPRLIKEPLIWKLGQKFPIVTNIRQASVTDEIGIVSLELDGKRADIKAAIKWLEKLGVSVEPVEINVIES